MRKLLVVDCCIRKEESRTKKILERFLSAAPSDCEVERLVLTEENLAPLMGDFFEQRQRLLETGDFSHPRFRYAKQFANADLVVIAAPFWSTISRKSDPERQQLTYLRKLFPSLLVTGPFSIVLGFEGGLMALNDRLKLRSMVVGEKDDKVYIASEEAAIRTMEPDVEHLYAPAGGEPVIVRVKEGVV